MRRTVTVALVGVGLSLTLASEGLGSTAAAPNVAAPATAEEYKTFQVTVSNCSSGSGYTAYIEEVFTRPDGSTTTEGGGATPDADGVTVLDRTLSPAGTWKIKYTCRHNFSSGGSGVWWEEEVTIEVTKVGTGGGGGTITADEREKCKKKRTKKKKKKCLRRAALD